MTGSMVTYCCSVSMVPLPKLPTSLVHSIWHWNVSLRIPPNRWKVAVWVRLPSALTPSFVGVRNSTWGVVWVYHVALEMLPKTPSSVHRREETEIQPQLEFFPQSDSYDMLWGFLTSRKRGTWCHGWMFGCCFGCCFQGENLKWNIWRRASEHVWFDFDRDLRRCHTLHQLPTVGAWIENSFFLRFKSVLATLWHHQRRHVTRLQVFWTQITDNEHESEATVLACCRCSLNQTCSLGSMLSEFEFEVRRTSRLQRLRKEREIGLLDWVFSHDYEIRVHGPNLSQDK